MSEQKRLINLPNIVSELTAVFKVYEDALLRNDTVLLNELFWDDPQNVRYGVAENLYGSAAIFAYRDTCVPVHPQRHLPQVVINTFGENFGVVSAEFGAPDSNKIGRQTQTWVRFPIGWRIVAAHVSAID